MKAVCLILTVVLTVFQASPSDAFESVQLNKGIALRQNALMMSWPSGIGAPLVSTKNFGISETRSRLWLSARTGDITVNTAVETRAQFNSAGGSGFGASQGSGSLLGNSQPLKRWDMTFDHIEGDAASLMSRIDRLDVVLRLGDFDIDIGRQPISLGTSHFVGVLDVVAPFAPGDLDATYKPGVDAIRVRRGVGMTGEAEIIAVGSKEWSDGALLGRFRTSFGSADFEFVGGRFRRRAFGGFGWEGGVNPIGYWGEMAMFERKDGETVRGGSSDMAFSGVTGLDYYIEADFVLGAGLMYQDFGVSDTDDLMSVYNDAPLREGWVFLGSSSYGVVTVSKTLHPLVQSSAAGLVSLVDGSMLWQPRMTVSTGDNTDISLYGWIASGEKPDIDGASITMKSEFGMMPAGGGFYARWFF